MFHRMPASYPDVRFHSSCFLNSVGNIVIAFTYALVTADFSVLALSLLHQSLQLSVIALRNSLGLHLDGQVATSSLDVLANVHNGLLQTRNTERLVEACVGEDVERGRDELDLDQGLVGVLGLGGAQGSLDGVDALVAEAGYFDIGTDLGRLGSETLANVALELVGDGLVGEGGVGPDFGVSIQSQIMEL